MRLTCAWSPGGAKTFRNRSGMIFKTWGRNMQNVSDDEKRYFIPDEGKEFIQIDVAGAEAVIVGYLCKAGPYRDLSIYGVKHHSYIAAHIYRNEWKKETPYEVDNLLSLPIKDLSEHPHWKPFAKRIKDTDSLEGKARRYYIGKKTGLSFNYKEGPDTFRFTTLKESEGTVILTKGEAEYFKMLYESIFPEIPDWQRRTEEVVRSKRLLRNLYGHPFRITSHVSDKLLWECIAWVPQSTVGVLATKAFVGMHKKMRHHCDVLNNTHDSVLIQAEKGQCALDCAAVLKELLEPTFESPYDGAVFKMKTEVSRGMNWAKKSDKNPEGLEEIKI